MYLLIYKFNFVRTALFWMFFYPRRFTGFAFRLHFNNEPTQIVGKIFTKTFTTRSSQRPERIRIYSRCRLSVDDPAWKLITQKLPFEAHTCLLAATPPICGQSCQEASTCEACSQTCPLRILFRLAVKFNRRWRFSSPQSQPTAD